MTDLRIFLSDRARWTTNIYRTGPSAGNSSLVASSSGDLTSDSSESMSRSARFKPAEELSRDAAQFSSRVTSLRHGHVAASGKVLDKLIDNSRMPVPDPMLDEQDRLEEKCANDLEAIGKFTMLVVMQWKKWPILYNDSSSFADNYPGPMKYTLRRKKMKQVSETSWRTSRAPWAINLHVAWRVTFPVGLICSGSACRLGLIRLLQRVLSLYHHISFSPSSQLVTRISRRAYHPNLGPLAKWSMR